MPIIVSTEADNEQCTRCYECEHYDSNADKYKCNAPEDINEQCMGEFRQWKIAYIKKWFPEAI